MTGEELDELGWVPHPTQTRPDGYSRDVAGPWIAPHSVEDEKGRTIEVRACIVVGWCEMGKHVQCWQADGVEPPAHSLEECNERHRLRCRCACHEAGEQNLPDFEDGMLL